jgi:hypothetical protein
MDSYPFLLRRDKVIVVIRIGLWATAHPPFLVAPLLPGPSLKMSKGTFSLRSVLSISMVLVYPQSDQVFTFSLWPCPLLLAQSSRFVLNRARYSSEVGFGATRRSV